MDILEVLQCSQINFDNLVRAYPLLAKDPFYRIARYQLDEGVRALEGKPSREIELTDAEQRRLQGLDQA